MILLTLITVVLAKTNPCHICKNGNKGLKYPMGLPRGENETCADIAIRISSFQASSPQCNEGALKFKSCCDGSVLPTRAIRPPTPPSVKYIGPHPICHLCITGEYPQQTSMVINLLYVGSGSCKQYYIAGRQGKIIPTLCDPLRYFAQKPCGCPIPTKTSRSLDFEESQSTTPNLTFNLAFPLILFTLLAFLHFKLRNDLRRIRLRLTVIESKRYIPRLNSGLSTQGQLQGEEN